ncbi:glycoside hydrolase family 140 protein [soil metagenome]
MKAIFKASTVKIILTFLVLICAAPLEILSQGLKVSPNQRFLVKADGSPFFYLGDTAWELFHRLNREEADQYLQNRADKGYTVIQAVVLAEIDGLNDPNPYGHTPLENNDPTKPKEDYFKHVDYIVNKAAELGLHIGMLPTWGDKLDKKNWGVGPEIFNPENARIYGEFLGKRYGGKNIIWVIGGDRNPEPEHLPVWRAMAEGVIAGAGGPDKALMTFHPQPHSEGSSSVWFHQDEWLDFNMFQTGHCNDIPVYDMLNHDYNLKPTKPTMDGEPIYEDHPVCFNAKEKGHSVPWDIRKAAYLGLFAGGHGHTYGCHSVWQMYSPKRDGINSPVKYWFESLDLPGATQMTHVRTLIESRPMLDRIPDQSLITDEGSIFTRIQATRGNDYAFIYCATGRPINVNLEKISGDKVKASWYDPRLGTTKEIGVFDNKGSEIFNPPSLGAHHDWVLILDDASKNYQAPKKNW